MDQINISNKNDELRFLLKLNRLYGLRFIQSSYYNPPTLQGLWYMWSHAEVYHTRKSTFNIKSHEMYMVRPFNFGHAQLLPLGIIWNNYELAIIRYDFFNPGYWFPELHSRIAPILKILYHL